MSSAYMTSFTLSYCSSRCFFVPPRHIQDARGYENIGDFHIYLICRAPRVRIVPDSIRNDEGVWSFCAKIGGEFSGETVSRALPQSWGISQFEASDVGGRTYKLVGHFGVSEGDFPLFWLKYSGDQNAKKHEVIYIGQAYGSDGGRNVIDRLTSHETLQKIISENEVDSPNSDIFVYGFQYVGNDQVAVMFDGTNKNLISDERDDERRKKILDSPPDDKEMTQIVEAGLIRYFQPIYNKKFREIFPNQDYGFLKNIRKLDYESIVVEINTEELKTFLFSSFASSGMHHIIRYNIKIVEDDSSPISYFRLMNGTGLHPSSGPFY